MKRHIHLNITLPEDLIASAKQEARTRGGTLSGLIRLSLTREIERANAEQAILRKNAPHLAYEQAA